MGGFPILIADDNDDDVSFLLQGFSDIRMKVTVTRVRDGASCVEKLTEQSGLSLILIDFYLPKMNGAEVVETLRTQGASLAPVVVLTSHISDEQRRRLQDAGVVAILEKPVDLTGYALLAARLVSLMGDQGVVAQNS